MKAWLVSLGLMAVSGAPAAEPLELTFAWAPGMSCKVRHSVQTTQEHEVVMSYLLKTSAASDGHLFIEISDARFVEPDYSRLPEAAAFNAQLPAMLMPAFEVDAKGHFVGLRDLEGARRAGIDLIKRQAWYHDSESERQRIENYVTREKVEEQVRQFWNPAVENWTGTNWKTGVVARSEGEETTFRGEKYHASRQMQLQGLRACGKTSASDACALLTVEADQGMRTETLTRPDTLVPVRVMFERGPERTEWLLDCGAKRL